LIPVALSWLPGTLIAFGVVVEGTIVTSTEAEALVFAWVAVTVTGLLPPGIADGALYVTLVPVPEMLPPFDPLTVQSRFAVAPVTTAVMVWLPPTVIEGE
jgi:hypothetical protein